MRPEPPAPRKKVGRQPTAALWQRTEEDILRVVHTRSHWGLRFWVGGSRTSTLVDRWATGYVDVEMP